MIQAFTSARTTEPDIPTLTTQLRTALADQTIGVQHDFGTVTYAVDKTTTWLAAQVTTAQTTIDTAPAVTTGSTTQGQVDALPLLEKAILLTILDELNNLREWIVSFKAAVAASTSLANLQTRVAALPDAPDRTVQQAITAVRNKAGSL